MNEDKKKSLGYILGQLIGVILTFCLAAIGVAMTVKLIIWIFCGI